MNRGTHGDSLVNFTSVKVTTQESPAFRHGECQGIYFRYFGVCNSEVIDDENNYMCTMSVYDEHMKLIDRKEILTKKAQGRIPDDELFSYYAKIIDGKVKVYHLEERIDLDHADIPKEVQIFLDSLE